MDTPLSREESYFAFRAARGMNEPRRSNRRSYRGGRKHQRRYRRKEMLLVAQSLRERAREEVRDEVVAEVKKQLGAETIEDRAEEFVARLCLAETNVHAAPFVARIKKMIRSGEWKPTAEQMRECTEILIRIMQDTSKVSTVGAIMEIVSMMDRRANRHCADFAGAIHDLTKLILKIQ
jgi:hypothetical protein